MLALGALITLATGALCLATGCGGDTGAPAAVQRHANGLPYCPDDPEARTEECMDRNDAHICPMDTGSPGDGLALCTPDPDEGMVLHYGPTHWDDPDNVALFRLAPGGDDENCTFVTTPNTTDKLINGYHGRMRPHSHHLILTTLAQQREPTDIPAPCSQADSTGARWLVGSQDPQIDVTIGGSGQGDPPAPGDPDYHLGQSIAAHTSIRYDMHYTNPTERELVREAWVYFPYADPQDIDTLVDMITFFQFGLNVPAHGEQITPRVSCKATTDRHVGLLTGHFHARGTRFSVWHDKADGTDEIAYETFNWADPGNLYYRDGTVNPVPNEATGTMGGHSGYLFVKAGESLSFQCAFKNTSDVNVMIGNTGKDEMCNAFGMYYPTDGNVWNCQCLGTNCSP